MVFQTDTEERGLGTGESGWVPAGELAEPTGGGRAGQIAAGGAPGLHSACVPDSIYRGGLITGLVAPALAARLPLRSSRLCASRVPRRQSGTRKKWRREQLKKKKKKLEIFRDLIEI